jgi:hypothetical protein
LSNLEIHENKQPGAEENAYYTQMNRIVNMAEGGPISDVAVTKNSDEDLILLSIGFRLVAEIGELRFWVCRMCNGDLVV